MNEYWTGQMYIEGTGFYTFKECHKMESLRNHTATAHKERERLGDRRNVGENSCNSGDGTGQMAQPLMFIMMMMIIIKVSVLQFKLSVVVFPEVSMLHITSVDG
jgi:hypothetical protein